MCASVGVSVKSKVHMCSVVWCSMCIYSTIQC